LRCSLGSFLVVLGTITLTAASANASIFWDWNYIASGITASGTLTTVDNPNADGGYLITGITGVRNGETIIGLQAAGTSILGNEPFVVDDLIFRGPGPQLDGDGFGFSTADGNLSNPFFADFLATPGYLEFVSRPPFTPGAPGPEDSELPVRFFAVTVSAPEPAAFGLVLCGLVLCGLACLGFSDARLSRRLRAAPAQSVAVRRAHKRG
jgi:hypothetical protein